MIDTGDYLKSENNIKRKYTRNRYRMCQENNQFFQEHKKNE